MKHNVFVVTLSNVYREFDSNLLTRRDVKYQINKLSTAKFLFNVDWDQYNTSRLKWLYANNIERKTIQQKQIGIIKKSSYVCFIS